MTLILTTPGGEQSEYKVAICENVCKTYLEDLYKLYNKDDRVIDLDSRQYELVESVTRLNVDEIVHPDEWLHCIKWSKFCRHEKDCSLEIFVARPKDSAFYYAIGSRGTLMVNRDNGIEIIKIHHNTVEVLSGETRYVCRKPMIEVIETKEPPLI